MTRILLLLEHKENRRLLAQWLESFYEVGLPDSDQQLEEPFDLCLLDGPATEQRRQWLQARKASEQPVFLPVILIASRPEVGMATRHLWQGVDELITSPIEKVELQARVEILLRTRQLSLELHQANKQLEELNILKSQFCSMVSHEFRNPLTVIYSCAQLLEIYDEPWHREKRMGYLRRIEDAAQGMTKLLDNVLVISRSDLEKMECYPAPLNLQEFCVALMEDMAHANASEPSTVANNQNRFTFVCEGQCSLVMLDRNLLQHILTNLVSNAIKYSPQDSNVCLNGVCDGTKVIFQIQDRGIGIPPESLPRLFESFHRAKNVGKTPGTGLGLSIVKRCVDLHGGQIEVSSELGTGTTFTVTLPLAPFNSPSMCISTEAGGSRQE